MSTDAKPKPRRWLRFSLRTFILLAPILGWSLSYLVAAYDAYRREKEMEELVELIQTSIVPQTSSPHPDEQFE